MEIDTQYPGSWGPRGRSLTLTSLSAYPNPVGKCHVYITLIMGDLPGLNPSSL